MRQRIMIVSDSGKRELEINDDVQPQQQQQRITLEALLNVLAGWR